MLNLVKVFIDCRTNVSESANPLLHIVQIMSSQTPDPLDNVAHVAQNLFRCCFRFINPFHADLPIAEWPSTPFKPSCSL